jgi:hypothetical protein
MSFINLEKYTKQANLKSIQAMINAYKEYKEMVQADPDFMWLLEARNQVKKQLDFACNKFYKEKKSLTKLEIAMFAEAKKKKEAFKKNESEGRAFFRNPDNSIHECFWEDYNYFKLEKYF